jgi:hypothetical protein
MKIIKLDPKYAALLDNLAKVPSSGPTSPLDSKAIPDREESSDQPQKPLNVQHNDIAGRKISCPALTSGLEDDTLSRRNQIDLQKANDRLIFAGETVDGLGKFLPQYGTPIDVLGDIVDVAGVIIGGLGMADALERHDKRALIGCSLATGASALGLIGTLTGHPSLQNASILAKFSKSGWTLLCQSLPEPQVKPTQQLGWTYDPISKTWKRDPSE